MKRGLKAFSASSLLRYSRISLDEKRIESWHHFRVDACPRLVSMKRGLKAIDLRGDVNHFPFVSMKRGLKDFRIAASGIEISIQSRWKEDWKDLRARIGRIQAIQVSMKRGLKANVLSVYNVAPSVVSMKRGLKGRLDRVGRTNGRCSGLDEKRIESHSHDAERGGYSRPSRWKEDWKTLTLTVSWPAGVSGSRWKEDWKVDKKIATVGKEVTSRWKEDWKIVRALGRGMGLILSRWKEDWKLKCHSERLYSHTQSRWKEDWKSHQARRIRFCSRWSRWKEDWKPRWL